VLQRYVALATGTNQKASSVFAGILLLSRDCVPCTVSQSVYAVTKPESQQIIFYSRNSPNSSFIRLRKHVLQPNILKLTGFSRLKFPSMTSDEWRTHWRNITIDIFHTAALLHRSMQHNAHTITNSLRKSRRFNTTSKPLPKIFAHCWIFAWNIIILLFPFNLFSLFTWLIQLYSLRG